MRYRRSFNRIKNRESHYYVNMKKYAERIWGRGIYWARMFSNINFQFQEPYDQRFHSITNMVLAVQRLSFAESVFLMSCPADESVGHILVCPLQKTVLLTSHLISKIFLPWGTVLDLCIRTGSTANACLIVRNHLIYIRCQTDDFCPSKFISFLEEFASQILNYDSDMIKSEEIKEATKRYSHGKGSVE